MLKTIPIKQLAIGMYIHDLNCGWMHHPFMRNRFMVDDVATLRKIKKLGIAEVCIDTNLGADVKIVESSATMLEEQLCELSAFKPNTISPLSPADKFVRAKEVHSKANKLMCDVMKNVRSDKPIALKRCLPIIDDILDVMFSSPSTFLSLAQMKTRDEYTPQHSVSVAALAVAFGRVLDLPRNEIRDIALGGLLHDVGKAKVPRRILNKQGRLSVEEFSIMKGYVLNTARLLRNTDGISETTFNAAIQHNERYDGTGYPYGLKGNQISLYGQMLAIVDVYDAITSISVYHKGMPPTSALRKLFKLSGSHFNPRLVPAFIKGIGIYPAGSLVRMESERLGIVKDVTSDKLLQPVVQLIYDCKKMCYIPPETIDISASNDKIKSPESFEKWGIDQTKWAMAHSRRRFRAGPASPN
jgi:HD-GYP domain-containing protein (c-di-GMP phosphodiesterase class II)